MKIAMIVNNMDVSGGYHKLVIRLSQQLEKKGHDVVVYTASVDRKMCYPDDIKTIKIVSLPPSVKHTSLNSQLVKLARLVPNNVDVIIIHDPMSLSTIASMKLKRSVKVIWMLNNQLTRDDIGQSKSLSLYDIRKQRLIRKGLRRVNEFVTYDKFNQSLVRQYLNRPATIVYAGADLDPFKKIARKTPGGKLYSFLTVGVIFPHRRYEDLIEAAVILKEKTHNFKITIVGRSDLHAEYAGKLKALIKMREVGDYIDLREYVTDKEMVRLYQSSEAFIFVNDGFTWGISVFEAVAAKLPVIITNNIGAADLIKNARNGFVVSPGSPKEIARALIEIVDNNTRATKMANRAYNELADFVSWEAYAERMLRVINI